jgi:hypothetical protein
VNLSPHFTFDELTRTGQTALQVKNREEAKKVLPALKDLAAMLEVIRAKFGPVRVTSAFRGPSVNAAANGSKTSQHLLGEAADIGCGVSDEELHKWIVTESGLKYGQCILEKPPGKSWVHISLGAPYRDPKRCNESLYFDGKSYTPKKY